MIDIVACFTVIGVSISLALLNELLLYIAVYRHSTYKIRKDAMERQALKVLKAKEDLVGATEKQKKEYDRLERAMFAAASDVSAGKMGPQFIMMIAYMAMFRVLSNFYSGRVVARLPFEPFSMLQGITHRGLEGDDFTECSYLFIYILSSMLFRPLALRLSPFALSRTAQSLDPGMKALMPAETRRRME